MSKLEFSFPHLIKLFGQCADDFSILHAVKHLFANHTWTKELNVNAAADC